MLDGATATTFFVQIATHTIKGKGSDTGKDYFFHRFIL